MLDFDELDLKVDEIRKESHGDLTKDQQVRLALDKLGYKKTDFMMWEEVEDGLEMSENIFYFMIDKMSEGKNFHLGEIFFLDEYNRIEETDIIITYEKKGK